MQEYKYKITGSDEVHTTNYFRPRRSLWVMAIGCGFGSLYYTCFVPRSDRLNYRVDYDKAWDILTKRAVRVHKLAVDVSTVKPCSKRCKCYEHNPNNLSFTDSGLAYFPEQLEVRAFFQVRCVLL